MILEKSKYIPFLITLIPVGTLVFYYGFIKTTALIEKYWICKKSAAFSISNVLFIVGIMVLSFALLDPKGDEEKVESSISDQKTIILIDSSLSMLVEDVRPNRFERALLLARHFIQRASGHQISIVLFSDLQKKIIPFTSDIDFLDAKLAGMDSRNVSAGGSNLSQALAESLRYFVESGQKGQMRGNVLIFSDFEEHEKFPISVPETVTVAAVGLGTAQGGPIPIRGNDGMFKGNKTFEGNEVISKLGEAGIKHMQREIPKFKEWIALSYSMPSEEIISYFRDTYLDSLKTGLVSTRPTLAKPVVALGMALIAISLLFKFLPAFVPLLVIIYLSNSFVVEASEIKDYEKLNKRERFKIAESYMSKGEMDKAQVLYEENNASKASVEDRVNYLTSILSTEKAGSAIQELNEIYNDANVGQNIKDIIRNNLLAVGKKQSQPKEDQEQKDRESKSNDAENDDKKDKNDKGKDNQKQKNEEKKQEGKEKDKPQDNQDKSEKSEDGQPKQADARQQLNEHEKKQEMQRKMIKLPALLKQLSDDDANLQRKYTDTATSDQGKNNESKDW